MIQMKKILSALLAVLMAMTLLSGVAMADGADTSRVVFGKNLTEDQKADLKEYFDVEDGVKELEVTIDEEKAWLGNLIPAEKIGKRSLSSIYIKATDEGSGLKVETKNINWVTPEMYMAVLTTAGIVDADIKIAAPVAVSGTAALAGVFKAYEDITGITLSRDAKQIAADELALTGLLADYLGSKDATELVNELKSMQDELKGKTKEEIREIVVQTAKDHNVSLTDGQIDQLVNLVKRLTELNIDPALLVQQAKQLQAITDKLGGLQQATNDLGGWFTKAWDDFTKWLKDLFG